MNSEIFSILFPVGAGTNSTNPYNKCANCHKSINSYLDLKKHQKKSRYKIKLLLLCGWKYNNSYLYGMPETIIHRLIHMIPKKVCYNSDNNHHCIIL